MALELEATVRRLPPPWEILELEPCKPIRIRVLRYEFGIIAIKPRWPGAPPEKIVKAVRLHVDPKYKPYWPHYWDVTPRRLAYQLAEIVKRPDISDFELVIHKVGEPPKAWFEVRLEPIR